MHKLVIRKLSLRRGGKLILRDISFSLRAGELLVIMGPSGGGKSSLLRCINRLHDIDSGEILLDGHSVYTLPVLGLRREVGMIFQKTAAFAGTVADNIAYGAALQGLTLSRVDILRLMRQASLDESLADSAATALSGGQEQRLAIARALALRPTLLLLDEPTSSLDPRATRRVEESLLRLQAQHKLTLIWVSHSIEQVRRVASRVLLLEGGRVLQEGSAAAMLDPVHGDARAIAFAHGTAAEA